MSSKLFVGNLEYSTTEEQLQETFARYGNVLSATVVTDRMTGRSRGFGFVEYETAEEARQATEELDGTRLNGRAINVSAARERRGDANRGGRSRPESA